MGLMHTEAIQVHAEAYDVALDISFPRGGWQHQPASASVGPTSQYSFSLKVHILCLLQCGLH